MLQVYFRNRRPFPEAQGRGRGEALPPSGRPSSQLLHLRDCCGSGPYVMLKVGTSRLAPQRSLPHPLPPGLVPSRRLQARQGHCTPGAAGLGEGREGWTVRPRLGSPGPGLRFHWPWRLRLQLIQPFLWACPGGTGQGSSPSTAKAGEPGRLCSSARAPPPGCAQHPAPPLSGWSPRGSRSAGPRSRTPAPRCS